MATVRWLEASTPWLIGMIIAWVAAGVFEFLLVRRKTRTDLEAKGCPYCGAPWTGLKMCAQCKNLLIKDENHVATRVLFSVGALAASPAIGILVVHLVTGK
ncbi:hypothetical protein GCM10010174_33280 [Kutzneria viridogrisea]|uniref:Uncharacterized protein n=2 Tax=Kutzneria TaxID=43356 RepID=W5WMT8_9PSEU|nr:hypothetical protein [Kutzneria albida]AHI02148.1 hypothetical protein KALB_8791 [Kutzneria albida DSM 43870]MBA8929289.1 hypothetical protein [Kutzneria viridogrisea]